MRTEQNLHIGNGYLKHHITETLQRRCHANYFENPTWRRKVNFRHNARVASRRMIIPPRLILPSTKPRRNQASHKENPKEMQDRYALYCVLFLCMPVHCIVYVPCACLYAFHCLFCCLFLHTSVYFAVLCRHHCTIPMHASAFHFVRFSTQCLWSSHATSATAFVFLYLLSYCGVARFASATLDGAALGCTKFYIVMRGVAWLLISSSLAKVAWLCPNYLTRWGSVLCLVFFLFAATFVAMGALLLGPIKKVMLWCSRIWSVLRCR